MWRFLTTPVWVGGLLVLIALAGRPIWNVLSNERSQIETRSVPTIESIQEAGDLIVLRVPVTDLREVSVDGYLGGQRALLLVQGVVEVGVDMRAARYANLDQANCMAHLELPQPSVVTAYLDHQRSRVHSISRHGAWVVALGDAAARRLIEEGLSGAQQDLYRFEPDADMMERARHSCESLLGSPFEAVGWRLKVVWN